MRQIIVPSARCVNNCYSLLWNNYIQSVESFVVQTLPIQDNELVTNDLN